MMTRWVISIMTHLQEIFAAKDDDSESLLHHILHYIHDCFEYNRDDAAEDVLSVRSGPLSYSFQSNSE